MGNYVTYKMNEKDFEIISCWIKEGNDDKNIRNFLNDNREFLECHSKNLLKLLSLIENEDVDNKSFINLIRHFPYINVYIHSNNYNITIIKNIIRLQIWHDNIHLVLNFRNDFLIDFYSYDKVSDNENDSLVYSMKGCFSSSSSLDKSYKIERLLSLFDNAI